MRIVDIAWNGIGCLDLTGRYQGACPFDICLLRAEVADLVARAAAADQANVPDGMQVPEELGAWLDE